MFTMQFLIALCLANALTVVRGAVNYCGAKMCDHINSHTFCQYPEGPSPACVGYIKSTLTTEEKYLIISRLNQRRNEAAGGHFRGMPTAGNMLKLRWVEELAREAQRWADQCRPPTTPEETDVCRDLYSIQLGQCVASIVGEAPGLRVETMVDIWFMQSIWYKGNVSFYLPPVDTKHYYGDFAQLLWSRSYLVGCGRSKFMTNWKGRLRSVERLVCNVGPRGPQATNPLWAVAPHAAVCPPRSWPDENYTSLCDFQQNNDINYVDDESTAFKEDLLINIIKEIEENKTMDHIGSLDEIYLTRLTIATLGDIGSTLTYNTMKNKNKMETIQFEDVKNNSTDDLIENMTKTENIKVRLLIGRPKSYNLDELLSNNIEDTTENEKPLVVVPKDFYDEYKLFEISDENNTGMARKVFKKTEENRTLIAQNVTRNEAESAVELDEALDSLENFIAQNQHEIHGKVRRELRKSTTKTVPDPEPTIPSFEDPAVTRETIETTSSQEDFTQLYNMVLKYMPGPRHFDGIRELNKGTEMHCLSYTGILILLLFVIL